MSKLYRVTVYDICGEFDWVDCDTREEMAAAHAAMRRKYPRLAVLAHNTQLCDYDTDGLDEDDEAAIDDAACADRAVV